MDYKTAGVNIEAGEALVDSIKPFVKATRTPGVLSEIGMFGGFFDARFPGLEHPVLVASADGVGTKLKVAIMAGVHDTVGQCLVNHCVNDILACGARPQFFLDYFATGKLESGVARDVIKGMAQACTENGCALLGGETAEMPSIYADGDYDVAGTIVGVVDKPKILNGSRVHEGDVLIGLPSSGLHTNGYSLARAALFPMYAVDQHINELGSTVGTALLAVHRSYLNVISPLLDADLVNGLSHITGGGIVGNTSRILRDGLALEIAWGSWTVPPIFGLIQQAGSVSDEEMRHVFNLGVGMIMVVSPARVDDVMARLTGEKPFIVGRVVASR
ncbi:MAG: phosphoribosylformylglycinamidine cyclo-ligase [Ignavibacteria bacterium]|nr:phosphoribosylformylglycinamidine cyclo-ligase [Ignavibacteria bacterium]MBK6418990.1 phosphoribosylformylglycinamidine cyclo-ligase [Ignavibacteria bacterium]